MGEVDILRRTDPEVAGAIRDELTRQREGLELIASENYAPEAVMLAQGSVMTNKYAEGLPGARYYGGCEHVDVVENLARERAKTLFGAEHANVQPHSGSQANTAVYFAVLNQHIRPLLPVYPVRCQSRHGGSRLRPARGTGPRAPSSFDSGRCQRLPAVDRLREDSGRSR